jgi:hypothetical protein
MIHVFSEALTLVIYGIFLSDFSRSTSHDAQCIPETDKVNVFIKVVFGLKRENTKISRYQKNLHHHDEKSSDRRRKKTNSNFLQSRRDWHNPVDLVVVNQHNLTSLRWIRNPP